MGLFNKIDPKKTLTGLALGGPVGAVVANTKIGDAVGQGIHDVGKWIGGGSAPQAESIQTNPEYSNQALNQYSSILQGSQPTYADLAFQNYKNQLNDQALSMARSVRGVSNPLLAMEQAQRGQAQMGAQLAGQQAAQNVQEKQVIAQALMDDYIKKKQIQAGIDTSNAAIRNASALKPADILSAAGTVGAAYATGGGSLAAKKVG
jgi:hypothetical protein